MNVKAKIIIHICSVIFLFACGFAVCLFTGQLGIAKAKAELDRSTSVAQYLETINKREGERIQREGEILSNDRNQLTEERNRFAQERIDLARARADLERERARLPAEFDAYNRIEKILADSIGFIETYEKPK
jgi:septal ring factor EnvC (AmiA/AmiB activator)